MTRIHENLIGDARRIHMIGIGGVGMSALARVLKHHGYEVSGSDADESKTTRFLRAEGIPVHRRLQEEKVRQTDLVIYSSAIPQSDPEMECARRFGIRIHHRAQILASLLHQSKTSIGVTGTHGKTTTTSMVSFALCRMNQNPTCLIGGDVMNFRTNVLLGSKDLWVAEVDESDRSHEYYGLNYAILTNLEQDHVERYSCLGDLRDSFELFVKNISDPGLIVYSAEDALSSEVVKKSGNPHVSTGFSPECNFAADQIAMTPFGSEFDLWEEGLYARRVSLAVPGRHNIANALSTIALLVNMGYDLDGVCETLREFKGARRRLELKGQFGDLLVIDDYAHHPTEVRASLAALQSMGKNITVVFQPHRYTRTAFFFKDFAAALAGANQVIVTDIHPAGEKDPGGVHAGLIYEELRKLKHACVQLVAREQILSFLENQRNLRGVVAFLGAGNIGGVADEFACRLKNVAAA